MSTEKQIAANQLNAKKCHGPITEKGKATSSQNALKTGIDAKSEVIRVESLDEHDVLMAEYYGRYNPTVPEERDLVNALIRFAWFGRRYACTEKSVWERGFNETDSTSLGLVFMRSEKFFDRLNHRINSAHRNYQRTLKQLREIQKTRLAEPELEVAVPATVVPVAAVPIPIAAVEIPDAAIPATLPSRDCKGAVPEILNPQAAITQLNPELVSFLEIPTQPTVPPVSALETATPDPTLDPHSEDTPPKAA